MVKKASLCLILSAALLSFIKSLLMSPGSVCPLILVSPKFPDTSPLIQPAALPKMHLFLLSEELLLIQHSTPVAQVTPPHLFLPNELTDLQLYMDFSILPFFSCAVWLQVLEAAPRATVFMVEAWEPASSCCSSGLSLTAAHASLLMRLWSASCTKHGWRTSLLD